MRRAVLVVAGAFLALCPAWVASTASADDTQLTISHVQPAGDEVNILLSVPVGATVDMDSIGVTLDGEPAVSSASVAGVDEQEQVRRTTVLAMDTSDSMNKNGRFVAAKAAATTFLETVPDDVYVGIVTFDSTVKTALEPTTDHDEAQSVIDGLTTARQTRLNEGIIQAVSQAGVEGQRSILVLSDGRDTSKTPDADVVQAITAAEVKVDVVALDQGGSALVPLRAMSAAGGGDVISSDPAALTAAFTAEAESLARQILVTATIPESVTADEATLEVTVPTGDTVLKARSYAVVQSNDASVPQAPRASEDTALQIPREAMYGGVAALGLGLLILLGSLFSMASAGSGPKTVEDRIGAYVGGGAPASGGPTASTPSLNLDNAKSAAASMLHRNKGLEVRIAQRLEAAGSGFKPAEWLLLQGALAILAGLVGLLLGGGSLLIVLICLAGGVVLPWLWLGHKRKKRIKAFNSGLADTLQLIAGSLSAGMSLAQSLDSVVNEGREPIAGEFQRVLVETRLGVPLEDALEGIAERIESKDFHWVVMAIRIQREVGGNLAELLTTVAGTLREREYLRRQVKSLSAEGRLSAYILCGLPVLVMFYLLLVRRVYIMPLFTTGLGILMLFGAAVLLSLGGFVMSRLVKVEV